MLSHKPGIHKNTGELIGDSLFENSRANGAVDASAQAENHLLISDLLFDFFDFVSDEIVYGVVAFHATHSVQEVAHNSITSLCALNLGMKLNGK